MTHLSDNLTLIPTVFFLLWFVSAGIFLVRAGMAVQGASVFPGPTPGVASN